MSVLVTGASGFIGVNVVEALLARGEDVIALAREPLPDAAAYAFQQLAGQLDQRIGDVSDAEAVLDLIVSRRPRRIIHAAAVTPGPKTELNLTGPTFAINVIGTAHVLRAASRAKVERVVLISSASIYGDNAFGSEPLDEEVTAPAPRAIYAVSKLAAERVALRYRELTGLDVAAVRLSAAFGPWERDTGVRETLSPFLQTLFLAQAGREAVVDRLCKRDWIYSRDAAGGIMAVMDFSGGSPIINLGPGVITPFDAWLDCLRARSPAFRWRVSSKEEANVDLHGDRDRSILSIRRLEQQVGWRPHRTLKAAFEDYLSWSDTHAATMGSH